MADEKTINQPNSNYIPKADVSGEDLRKDFVNKTGKYLYDDKIGGITKSQAGIKEIQEPEINPTTSALLGSGYILKLDGELLVPNYKVLLEAFNEIDRSLDLQDFVDVRISGRDQKFIFDTDKIVGIGAGNTNDINQVRVERNKKTVKRTQFIVNLEWNTVKTILNIRDNEKTRVGFEIKAADLEQHQRAERLNRNGFLLSLFQGGATSAGIFTFDDTLTGDLRRTAMVLLGGQIANSIEKVITSLEELMTNTRPGGFSVSDMFGLLSPLAQKSLHAYFTDKGTGDISYVETKEGTYVKEGSKFTLLSIPLYQTNLLVDGNKLDVVIDVDGVLETRTIYENTERVEVIIGLRNYAKYGKVAPVVKSSPTNVDGITEEHLITQKTEHVHNGEVINPELFSTIQIQRESITNPVVLNNTNATNTEKVEEVKVEEVKVEEVKVEEPTEENTKPDETDEDVIENLFNDENKGGN